MAHTLGGMTVIEDVLMHVDVDLDAEFALSVTADCQQPKAPADSPFTLGGNPSSDHIQESRGCNVSTETENILVTDPRFWSVQANPFFPGQVKPVWFLDWPVVYCRPAFVHYADAQLQKESLTLKQNFFRLVYTTRHSMWTLVTKPFSLLTSNTSPGSPEGSRNIDRCELSQETLSTSTTPTASVDYKLDADLTPYQRSIRNLQFFSDELFLLWRIVGCWTVAFLYIRYWIMETGVDFRYLTQITAMVTLIHCFTLPVLQIVAYTSMKRSSSLYSQGESSQEQHRRRRTAWAKGRGERTLQILEQESALSSPQDAIDANPGLHSTKWRLAYVISAQLAWLTPPANLFVIALFWTLCYKPDNCLWDPVLLQWTECTALTFHSICLHGIGGTFILIDWTLSGYPWLVFNGWLCSILAIAYSTFLALREHLSGRLIYKAISIKQPFGVWMLVILNTFILPIVYVLFAALKRSPTLTYLRKVESYVLPEHVTS